MTELEESLSTALAQLATQYRTDMNQLQQQNQQLSNRTFTLAEQIDRLNAKVDALTQSLLALAES